MKLLICRCRQCRYVRKISKYSHQIIRCYKKAARARVKQSLKQGEYEALPEKVKVPYSA